MSVLEPRSRSAARLPNLRGDRLSVVFCFGAIAIGIIALIGYVLANASIAALSANGKPISAVTALALIVLGAGILALRSPAPAGVLTARRAALGVVGIAAADLLSAAFSPDSEQCQVWASRGSVHLHSYPVSGFLILALAAALFLVTTRMDLAGHLIASAVLLINVVFLFAYALQVPSFLDPSRRVAPVAATTIGLVLISAAEVLARPRGWAVPMLARTSTGRMSRVLLPTAIGVPLLALALRNLIAHMPGFTPEIGLTGVVVFNVLVSVAIILIAGVGLHKRASDRSRLASIVESSDDAIIGASSAGLVESWNGGAERMYGYTAAEAIGRSVTMLAPPERQDEAPRVLERIRRGDRADPFETVHVAKDGRRVDVWVSVSPVLNDEGNVIGFSSTAHDLAGRKKAEEKIRRQAEQYAAMLATTSDGFWITDLEGRLLDVNDAYCRMSGYSSEELLKLRIGDIDAIETPEQTASRIRSIVESGFARFETKHRTKDNRILDIEGSVSPLRTTGQMLVFMRDITQRKATEEALKKSEAALKEAQRGAQVGHWEWSALTGATTWSDEVHRILGIPIGSATPSYELLFGVIDQKSRRRIEEDIARAIGSSGDLDGVADIDLPITTPAGTKVMVSQRVWVDRNAAGNVVGLHGTCQDITKRVETEKALRDRTAALASKVEELRESRLAALNMMEDVVNSARALEQANRDLELQIAETKRSDEANRRLATVVEQAAETIVVTDLDGTIVYVNPAFEKITGYTWEEAIGQNPRILASGEQTTEFYQQLWSTIRAGGVWQGHFTNRRKDGTLYEEDATISPVRNALGTIINYVAIKREVTEEIALAEQFRHAQKIEAIGTLAAGVAHDFNNLLQAMVTFVGLLKKTGIESSRRLDILKQLELTIQRGSSLTRQLLLFARREISKRETLDLNQILGDLVAFLRRVVRADIRLTVEPANVPLRISADRGQIEQVITNLAVNAIDAMPEGGALSIVASGAENAGWIKVSDTGTGIPETIRDRVFEPFFTTKGVGKGTGLGLSVVHGIIAAHGGRIDVECPAAGGTTFRIELPLQNAVTPVNVATSPEEDMPNGRGERVLLVEDDEAAREGLSGILEMLGYSVVAVGTGEEAVGVDQQLPFSVVLTDFMLPDIPGIEVVCRLRDRWPDMRAILMSGYAAPDVIDAAVAANECQFLQKPFDMAELARTLRAVLEPPDAPGVHHSE